jgi:hypothetical protein
MHIAVFKQFHMVIHGDPTGVEYRIVKNAVTMQITEPVVGNIKVYKEWTVPWGSVEVRRLIPKEWEDRVEPGSVLIWILGDDAAMVLRAI